MSGEIVITSGDQAVQIDQKRYDELLFRYGHSAVRLVPKHFWDVYPHLFEDVDKSMISPHTGFLFYAVLPDKNPGLLTTVMNLSDLRSALVKFHYPVGTIREVVMGRKIHQDLPFYPFIDQSTHDWTMGPACVQRMRTDFLNVFKSDEEEGFIDFLNNTAWYGTDIRNLYLSLKDKVTESADNGGLLMANWKKRS